MKYLEYKGYTGTIAYSREDNLLYGKVLGIQSLISYEGETGKMLEADFRNAINSYLDNCKNTGKTPEKPFKGSFNVRISSELHQKAALLAMDERTSLNNVVAQAVSAWIKNGNHRGSKRSKLFPPD
jgi:predicted HicB family RNase H-like nuclease